MHTHPLPLHSIFLNILNQNNKAPGPTLAVLKNPSILKTNFPTGLKKRSFVFI